MATNSILSRFQSLARGAGYGPSDYESAAMARAHKEQTDEHDTANLDTARFRLDEYTKRFTNDWNIYQNSLRRDPANPVLPKGFGGSWEDYEAAHARGIRNLDEKKYLMPSDIQTLYGLEDSIDYENISGEWTDILGPGKFMSPVTSEHVDDDEFGPSTNYQVSTVNPDTGQAHDANPTYSGTPVAKLHARGGDAEVEAASWPPVPNEARDTLFETNMSGLYKRSPGSMSSMLTLADRQIDGEPFSPGRAANEQAAMQAVVDALGGRYAQTMDEIVRARGEYATQEERIDAEFAKAQETKRGELGVENTAIQARNEELVEAARLQARNPEGTGYGVGGTDDPSTPDVNEALPMGQELWDRLPKWAVVPGSASAGPYLSMPTYVLEDSSVNPDLVGMENYVAVKDAIPLNMTRPQWNSLKPEQREVLQERHDHLVRENLRSAWRDTVSTSAGKSRNSVLAEELETYRNTSVPQGVSAAEYDDTLKNVEAFWDRFNKRGQGGSGDNWLHPDEESDKGKLWKFLRNNPEELALFKESPLAFAQKHMDNNAESITGAPPDPEAIADADIEGVKKLVDIDAVINAMERPVGTLTQENIAAIQAEAAKLKGEYTVKQEEMARLIDQNQRENRRLDKEDRAATALGVISVFPEGDARFGQLLQAMPSWIERGTWDDFQATFDQENVRLEQYARQLDQADIKLDQDQQTLELRRQEYDQDVYEFEQTRLDDNRKSLEAARNTSAGYKDFRTTLTNTRFFKLRYNTDGASDGPVSLDQFTAEDFGAYIEVTNQMMASVVNPLGLPQSQWSPAQWTDYEAVKADIAAGVKIMLRSENQRNTSFWQSFMQLFGKDWTNLGPAAFDSVSQLVAFKEDNSPADTLGEVAYYKHINPRTGQEQGNDMPATDLHAIFGPLGGREMLWALSVGNNERFRQTNK